jgi:hypothetical protein
MLETLLPTVAAFAVAVIALNMVKLDARAR